MSRPTILGFFAHPDDELMAGGTMARYAEAGADVVVCCATRGEVGEISEAHLATPDTLADVRSEELRAAAALLGITDVRFLGFRDSGMVGTPENDDPRSLNRAAPADAVGRIVHLIREVRPTIVITHDPTGGYGHPDHIALSGFVTTAFSQAADAAHFPEAGAAWQAERLYYGVMARSFFEHMREMMVAAGVDTAPFERPGWENMGYPDEEITHSVDVSDYNYRKWAAFEAHRTQFGPNSPMRQMPEEMRARAFGFEHYVLAWPQGAGAIEEGLL